jgi:urease accessory protein
MPLNSEVHIETVCRQGKTILKRSYCTQPFKLADITEDKGCSSLQLMLMSSSPGMLDGDNYRFRIDVSEGCSVELQTQSYQGLFRMKKGALQQMDVRLQNGSSFTYLPHPLVPHEDADLITKNKIHLSGNCSLAWGEVITCGRKLNGEVFRFNRYHSITEIFLNERLVVKENLLVRPAATNLYSIGQMEGYTHQASLLYLDETVDVAEAIQTFNTRLEEQENISFGLSALPVNGLVLRLLGYKAEQLHGLLRKLAALLDDLKQTQKSKTHVI